MQPKFKIFKHRQSDNLHLRLAGEFNDVSVCELIDVLKDNCNEVMKVFIHTSNLNNISTSSIGRDVFHRNINYLNNKSLRIQFTGSCEKMFSPINAA